MPSRSPSGGIVSTLVKSDNLIIAGCHGNQGGVFVSENHGATWKRVTKTNRPSHLSNNILVNKIIRKDQENVFYVATEEGVYKLFRGETEWELKMIGFNFMPLTITDITYFDSNLFISIWGNGIRNSKNEGLNWWSVNNGLTELNVGSLNHSGDTIFAGTEHGLFYSTDLGSNWAVFNEMLNESYIIKIMIDDKHICASEFRAGAFVFDKAGNLITRNPPGEPYQSSVKPIALIDGFLYGQLENKALYQTPVNDINWVKTTTSLHNARLLTLLKQGSEFIVGTDGHEGVLRSADNGATWMPLNEGIVAYRVNALASSENKVFMATNVCGAFVSEDYGFTWNPVHNQPPGFGFNDILVKDGIIYFAGYGLYVSSDNGITWKTADKRYFTGLAANEQTVFAASQNEGLISSSDRGASWQEIDFPYTDNVVHSIAASDSIIIMGTHYDGLYVSKDYGYSWQTKKNLGGLAVLSVALRGNTTFIAAGCGIGECSKRSGVHRSMDLGETWQYRNYGFDYAFDKVLVRGNIVYGYFMDKIVYSRDNAMTWEYFDGNIVQTGGRISAGAQQISGVQAVNVSDAYIYVAASGGIYIRENSIDAVLRLEDSENLLSVQNLSLYPNPASFQTTISFTLDHYEPNLNINILDMQGRVLYESKPPQNQPGRHSISLDTSVLSPGTYLARIYTSKSSVCKKLIVYK